MRVPAVTAAQMREVDRLAVDVFSLSLLQMMENAGRNLAENVWHMRAQTDTMRPERVVVLAGSGGNGGGGLCCARHLHNHGYPVQVILDRPAEVLAGAAKHQLTALQRVGLQVLSPTEPLQDLSGVAVIVDALIGYGLRGAPRGRTAQLIEMAAQAADKGARVLSLDVPSGLNATTGEARGAIVRPERTLTLALPKTGLTPEVTGDLYLADIGVPLELYARLGLEFERPFGTSYWVPLATHTREGD